jgi:hypothetical protein
LTVVFGGGDFLPLKICCDLLWFDGDAVSGAVTVLLRRFVEWREFGAANCEKSPSFLGVRVVNPARGRLSS